MSALSRCFHRLQPSAPPMTAPQLQPTVPITRPEGAGVWRQRARPSQSSAHAPATDVPLARPSSAAAHKPRKRAPAATSSGYKGVSWIDNSKKWRAQVGGWVSIVAVVILLLLLVFHRCCCCFIVTFACQPLLLLQNHFCCQPLLLPTTVLIKRTLTTMASCLCHKPFITDMERQQGPLHRLLPL